MPEKKKKLRIAMVGTKGIPAKWGGIEVYVEEIARRLLQRGHYVSVYSRRWFAGNSRTYAGINVVRTPTLKTKSTDALLHGMTASIHAAASDVDIVHYHGLASYFSAIFPRLVGKKVVITMHATSWVEPKWNAIAVKSLKAAVIAGMRVAHTVTTVSPVVRDFLESTTRRNVILTPPGVEIGTYRRPEIIFADYGLKANTYILFMGRFDTVKRIDWLIEAFISLQSSAMKLVITGDPGPSDGLEYKEKLIKAAGHDKRIIFTGFQSGIVKEELISNCFLFVLPSLNEGVPISLLEAMSYGRPCLASDIPPHRCVISDGINGFLPKGESVENFRQKLRYIIALDNCVLNNIGENGMEFVRNHFNWDNTIDRLEATYYSIMQ